VLPEHDIVLEEYFLYPAHIHRENRDILTLQMVLHSCKTGIDHFGGELARSLGKGNSHPRPSGDGQAGTTSARKTLAWRGYVEMR